jgi:hypothetical protein
MNYPTYVGFHAAPLALRTGGKRDYFPYLTIILGFTLAFFCLTLGLPRSPSAETEGVFIVYGP